MNKAFSDLQAALQSFALGEMVVVFDEVARKGDLTMAAELVTPEALNFMGTYGRGLICLPMSPRVVDQLALPYMPKHNNPRMDTAFMVPIKAAGISTTASAADRAKTVEVAVNPNSEPDDIATPGYVFPLRAKPGGVLQRAGHTEAAVDLASLAGLRSAAVICGILSDDGNVARIPELDCFRERHGLNMITVTQIIEHRREPATSRRHSNPAPENS